jgi:hypothetical protein
MALVLFGATAVFAQADVSTATLKGTITDQSGGRIADAVVVATDTEHGIRREAKSDSGGVSASFPGAQHVRRTRGEAWI